jgi:hypothetical protein
MRLIDTAFGNGDRPFQGFDDFGNRNHTGRAGQGITTVRAAGIVTVLGVLAFLWIMLRRDHARAVPAR